MAYNYVVRMGLGAVEGINQNDTTLAEKIEAGTLGLAVYGSTLVDGICVDQSDNIYVSDSAQHCIYKITRDGNISVFAGKAGTSGNNASLNGVAASSARFNTPKGIACDKSGNIFVADSGNNQVRIIHGGKVSLVAGNGDASSGFVDGSGANAMFNAPIDVAVDNSGTLWVADNGNDSIRRIIGSQVVTYAGSETGDNEKCRVTTRALFNKPTSVACDPQGNIYVADNGNYKIKKITTDGWVYLFSGSGVIGRNLGTALTSTYSNLGYSAIDKSGNLYIVDALRAQNDSRLLRINPNGVPGVVADLTQTTKQWGIKGVTVSAGQTLFMSLSSAI